MEIPLGYGTTNEGNKVICSQAVMFAITQLGQLVIEIQGIILEKAGLDLQLIRPVKGGFMLADQQLPVNKKRN